MIDYIKNNLFLRGSLLNNILLISVGGLSMVAMVWINEGGSNNGLAPLVWVLFPISWLFYVGVVRCNKYIDGSSRVVKLKVDNKSADEKTFP